MIARRISRWLPSRVVRGGSLDGRARRYAIAGAVGCITVWGLSGAYLALSPKTFTSGFVLVLPGTGAGTTVNLPTLGQATSTSSSPFASPELSPTENYRKMLLSRRVTAMAAATAGETEDHFPTPKIELADQTKLISVKIVGRSPRQAEERAEALRRAFLGTLDTLRQDEIRMRDEAYRAMLDGYKTSVDEARQRLTDYEAHVGLVSVDQYATIVSALERMRDSLHDTDTKLAAMRAGVRELTRLLGVTAESANLAMAFRGDPQFQVLLEQLAKQDAELTTASATHGPANARVTDLSAERAATAAKLSLRASDLVGGKKLDVLKMRDLSIRDERGRLFERLVGQIADIESLAATRVTLASQIDGQQKRVAEMAPAASRLDALKRDVQVAEAVFSSALARIDTSKSDYFASYPMVQTLEQPEAPTRRSGPLPMLAAAGAASATILIIASLVLTWARTALFRKMLKSA